MWILSAYRLDMHGKKSLKKCQSATCNFIPSGQILMRSLKAYIQTALKLWIHLHTFDQNTDVKRCVTLFLQTVCFTNGDTFTKLSTTKS